MLRIATPLLALALVSFWSPSPTMAGRKHQPDTFRASLDRTAIFLGETVTLKVEININRRYYGSLRLPRFRRTRIVKRKKKTLREARFVGGKSQIRYIWRFEYILKPRRAGVFKSREGRMRVGRTTFFIPPLTITVRKGKPIPKATTGKLPDYIKASGDVFLYPVLSPKEVYVDQQATISWYLFRRVSVHIDQPQLPRLSDFWKEPLVPIHPLSDWKIRHLQGKQYSYTLALRYAIFPMRPGKLTVDGLSFRSKRSFAGPSDQGKLVQSPALTLKVRALPASATKADKIVGRYKLSARFLQARFRTREPISFEATISGVGNLRQLSAPTLSFPSSARIRIISTRGETQLKARRRGLIEGSKRFLYILRAEKPGTFKTPALRMTYFDPWQQQQLDLRTSAIAFKVMAGPKHLMAILKKRNRRPAKRGLKLSIPKLKAPGSSPSDEGRSVLWLLLPLPILGLGAWFVLRRKDPVLEEEKAAAIAASEQVQQEYQNAQGALQRWLQQHPQFDANAQQALGRLDADLNALLQAWLARPIGGLSRQQLLRALEREQAPAAFVQALQGLQRSIDQARFSPIQGQGNVSGQLQHFLQQLQQLPPRS